MTFCFQPMDEHSARHVLSWQYAPPYDCYNLDMSLVPFLADSSHNYYSISDETDTLVAFCCFGAEARVPGGDYEHDALDLGLGVRPDLTGQGRGGSIVAALVEFAHRTFAPSALRVTVAAFNQRAQRVWTHAGFVQVEQLLRERDKKAFVVLLHQKAHA